MAKFYAVKNGKVPGIYSTWEACKKQVTGFSGAVYKSFTTKEEAEAFIKDQPKTMDQPGLIAYVDGSYNIKTKEYGYGCVLLDGQNVVKELLGKGDHPEYASMRNVAGEIFGSEVAINYAIEHGYSAIYIYYDYEGIQKWADGLWKANKVGTQRYQQIIKEFRKKIAIQFIKVLAHSGDLYNERADYLAKKAAGVINED
ncbi:MAG: viroplasmin family protein [Beduini sp.]|uniref:ribonuclease H1 domain-containing protein n=1 Tax=Beduini sp. TaxID=1922300 RepID=UPI0039A16BB6